MSSERTLSSTSISAGARDIPSVSLQAARAGRPRRSNTTTQVPLNLPRVGAAVGVTPPSIGHPSRRRCGLGHPVPALGVLRTRSPRTYNRYAPDKAAIDFGTTGTLMTHLAASKDHCG